MIAKPRTLRRALAVAALLGIGCDEHVGCTPVLQGENAQLEFHDETLVVGAADRVHARRAMVEGSRFCPAIGCAADVPGCVRDEDDDVRLAEPDVRACYQATLVGPVTEDGPCIVADAPGELDWSFVPQLCPANGVGYAPGPDRLTLPIVAAAEITPWLQATGDGFAVRELVAHDGGTFPDGLQLAPGSTAHVLADATVHLAVVLAHAAQTDAVAWTPSQWTLEAVADDGSNRALVLDPWGVIELALPESDALELSLVRDTLTLPIGRVESIGASEITELEVIAGFARDDEAPDGHRMPIGARAVARTADGRAVFGVPVTWEVTEGELPLWRDESLPWDPDYTALIDREGRACHAPPERRTTYHAAVLARWGQLEATTELEWVEDEVDEGALEVIKEWFTGEDYDPAEACEGPGFPDPGCACSNGDGAAGWLPGAALVVLALRRRRRTPALSVER